MDTAVVFYNDEMYMANRADCFDTRHDASIIPRGSVVVGFLKFNGSHVEELLDPPCMTEDQKISWNAIIKKAKQDMLDPSSSIITKGNAAPQKRFTFVHVTAVELGCLDVDVRIKVVDAENEKAAWEEVAISDEDLTKEEKKDSDFPRQGIHWYRDRSMVSIMKLIPEEPGWHTLACESNG